MATRSRSLATLAAAAVLAGGFAGCAARTEPAGAPSSQQQKCQPTNASSTETITEANSGSTICLAVGQHLEVFLHGSLGDTWAPISVDGQALSASANGKGTLPVGVTGGFFVGGTAGVAKLTSSRPACPDTAASPCAAATFVVDVQVS
jgi:hypothetical protein